VTTEAVTTEYEVKHEVLRSNHAKDRHEIINTKQRISKNNKLKKATRRPGTYILLGIASEQISLMMELSNQHTRSQRTTSMGGPGGRKVGIAPSVVPPQPTALPGDDDNATCTIDIYGSSTASPPAKSDGRRSNRSLRESPFHTILAMTVASLIIIGLVALVVIGAMGKLGSGNKSKETNNFDPKTFNTEGCLVTEILPEDRTDGLHFGSTVTVQGDTAVIGAYNDDTGMGSVYVFEKEKTKRWKQEANFFLGQGSSGDPGGSFSSSLALDGDTFVVGKPNDDRDVDWSGSALVFRRTSDKRFPWQLEGVLRPSQQEERDYFGQSVDLRSDTAIVGANCNVVGINSGAAFIFRRYPDSTFWTQEAKLLPGKDGKDGSSNDEFGNSVALSDDGNRAFVGSWLDADRRNQSMGSVYIYHRTAIGVWEQEDRLLPPYGRVDTSFGKSIAVDDEFVVVGAPGSPWEPHSVGAAYIYRRHSQGWILSGILRSISADLSHSFGENVVIEEGAIVVSSRAGGAQAAGLSVFLNDGYQWVLHNVIQPDPSRVSEMGFASSISTDGNNLLVGARKVDKEEFIDTGAAYLFGCNFS